MISRFRHGRVCRRRRRLCRAGVAAALDEVLQVGLPRPEQDVSQVPFLSLDFETTGLDPRSDRIVSAGWVQLAGSAVRLATAREMLVRPEVELRPESVTIHGIGDDRAAEGVQEEEMLRALLKALRGSVVVAHHAPVEVRFLDAALRRTFGAPLPCLVVDTLALERRLRRREGFRLSPFLPEDDQALDLGAVRRGYGLPAHRAHGALADALATAELLAAQCAHLAADSAVKLGRLL